MFTFFVISGYLFKPVKKKGEIRRQYLRYLLIYIVTAFIMVGAAAVHDMISGNPESFAKSLLIGSFYGASDMLFLFGYKIHPPYALWFFAVFMNSWLILELLMKIKKETIRHGIIFGCPVLFFLLCICVGRPGGLIFTQLPFYPFATIMAIMLLYIGYLMKKENILFKKIRWYWWSIILPVAVGTYFLGKIDMMNSGYRLNILDCIGGICGAFIVMYWYIRIISPDNRLLTPLMWIGRRSLIIIPIHCVEWALFMWMDWRGLGRFGIYGSAFLIFFLRGSLIVLTCLIIEHLQIKYKKWRLEVKSHGKCIGNDH